LLPANAAHIQKVSNAEKKKLCTFFFSVPTFDCAKKQPGFYRDPFVCGTYYICERSSGQAWKFQCDAGQAFDVAAKECRPEAQVASCLPERDDSMKSFCSKVTARLYCCRSLVVRRWTVLDCTLIRKRAAKASSVWIQWRSDSRAKAARSSTLSPLNARTQKRWRHTAEKLIRAVAVVSTTKETSVYFVLPLCDFRVLFVMFFYVCSDFKLFHFSRL
jgi:hypothetical protein